MAGAMDLLGIPVDFVDKAQVLDFMAGVIADGHQAAVLNVNVNLANLAAQQPWLKAYFHQGQMVFCDGDGIRWALRILGLKVPPKVTYNDFIWDIARWCEERSYSLYLLGGRPGVAERAASHLKARLSRLRILGTHHGYFEKQCLANDGVVAEINRLCPDVLLVCFGMPTQERWVRDNAPRLAVHAIMTGGAALDYAAGMARMTPRWIKRLQMEWLFRFLLEPRRLFFRYFVGNPLFFGRVVAARLRQLSGRPRAGNV
jgi:N-acetylglucosaminyldiphosphoundecaprenol N-acetyl-beta-D-mannosaminyltransferase